MFWFTNATLLNPNITHTILMSRLLHILSNRRTVKALQIIEQLFGEINCSLELVRQSPSTNGTVMLKVEKTKKNNKQPLLVLDQDYSDSCVDSKWLIIKVIVQKECSDRSDVVIGSIGHILHCLESLLDVIEWTLLCTFICREGYFDAQIWETLLYKQGV